MEEILVGLLRIRNERLRKEGKPKSPHAYIRKKAEQFYFDMYGDSATSFKFSSGWVFRFQDRYKHVLDPDVTMPLEDTNQIVDDRKSA